MSTVSSVAGECYVPTVGDCLPVTKMAMTWKVTRVIMGAQPLGEKPIAKGEKEPLEDHQCPREATKLGGPWARRQVATPAESSRGCGSRPHLQRAVLWGELNWRRQESQWAGGCSQSGMVPVGILPEDITVYDCSHQLACPSIIFCMFLTALALTTQGLSRLCCDGLMQSTQSQALKPEHISDLRRHSGLNSICPNSLETSEPDSM